MMWNNRPGLESNIRMLKVSGATIRYHIDITTQFTTCTLVRINSESQNGNRARAAASVHCFFLRFPPGFLARAWSIWIWILELHRHLGQLLITELKLPYHGRQSGVSQNTTAKVDSAL